MFKNPPLTLVLTTVIYLGFLTWSMVVSPSVVVGGVWLALAAMLFFFVLRGSKVAARIMAVLSGLSSLLLLLTAVATFQTQPRGAAAFTVMAILLILFVAYLWRSDAMKRFQARSRGHER